MHMVRPVLLAIALACLLPSVALADTVTTGPARPGGDATSARLHISVTPSCTISPDYGAEWQRVSGGSVTRIGVNAPGGGQPFEGDVPATGLVPGAVYRYRAYGSTYCQNGTYQPTTYGAYLCFMAGRTQADGTLNVDCATPESTGGGSGTGGGGSGTGGGGTTNQPPTGSTPHVRAPGHRCYQPSRYKFVSVLQVKAKGVRCSTIYRLVYSDRNRSKIGSRRRFSLPPSDFVCKAVARRTGNADYRCSNGSGSWYMHTYASGPWSLSSQVFVDY
jgi:hypothetical protein